MDQGAFHSLPLCLVSSLCADAQEYNTTIFTCDCHTSLLVSCLLFQPVHLAVKMEGHSMKQLMYVTVLMVTVVLAVKVSVLDGV